MRVLHVAAMALGVAAASPVFAGATPDASSSPQAAGASTANGASAQLPPGTTLTAQDADRLANQVPAAAKLALKLGLRMRITPTERLEWSAGFERATEKYAPQTTLDDQDHLKNYTAGMPFPLIDVADPKAAAKIAYNWHLGPVMPDDFSLAPWGSSGYAVDPEHPGRLLSDSDHDFACEQFDFLRYAHRTEVDPRPTLGENATGVEWKARCSRWTAFPLGGGIGEGAGIWIRHLDPASPDEFYGFDQATRRVRRSAVNLEYPAEGCRSCHQPYWAYALPKTEIYSYRLLGTTAILACMKADREPAGIAPSGEAFRLTEEPFQLRRAYILEMTPRAEPEASNMRTVVYVDSEIYVWLAAEFYQHGELSAVTIPLWRMTPSPEGGNLFDIAGSFYFPTATHSYFRSLVPAHSSFTQAINHGDVSESSFVPQLMR